MRRQGPSRRAFLAGAAALLAQPAARAALPVRVASVDWALLETLLALGHPPVAAVELELYRRIVIEPQLPGAVADLGLRGSINFERMALVAPDLIYGSNYSAWANETLRRIAPVRELTIFTRGERPFVKAEDAMRLIGEDLSLQDRAREYISALATEFGSLRGRLAPWTARPLLVANLGDARHFRAFGEDSMFGDVASRLGFRNAFGPRTSYSATAPVGIERIAAMGDATLLVIGPVPPEAHGALFPSALWRALPPVAEGRVHFLEPVNPFGGLPAARRFARLLAQALEPA